MNTSSLDIMNTIIRELFILIMFAKILQENPNVSNINLSKNSIKLDRKTIGTEEWIEMS